MITRCVAPKNTAEIVARLGGSSTERTEAAQALAVHLKCEDGERCGETATTERQAGGVLCPLCAAHAAQLDAHEASRLRSVARGEWYREICEAEDAECDAAEIGGEGGSVL